MLVLKNCKLIPELVEGYQGDTADILIEDGRIKKISACGEPVLEEACVYDMEGKYTLPGFIDMHVHLTLSGGDTLIDNMKSPVQQALDAVKFAKDTLMAGFTTIRDVGSCDNVAIDLRNAIDEGKLVGPRISLLPARSLRLRRQGMISSKGCIPRRTGRKRSGKQSVRR